MEATTIGILIIALVAVTGLLLGEVRCLGISLGSAGVLFAGLAFGHFGARVSPEVLSFAKEFGLILFVFTIGIQLGPGIVQLWKRQGLLLNGLVLALVIESAVLVGLAHWGLGLAPFAGAGLFSGATTNTPSLGAAEQAATMVSQRTGAPVATLAAAYAVTYPGGIVGTILAMLVIRWLFKIDVETEARQIANEESAFREPIERRGIVVDNPHLAGVAFGQLPGIDETGVRISRIRRTGETDVHPANDETLLQPGDVIQVVGTPRGLDRFMPMIGRTSELDLMVSSGDAEFRRVFITNPEVLNRPLRELSLDQLFGVTVTRISRAEVEMTAKGSSRFHFGDTAQVVGDRASLDLATRLLGNSRKALKETPFSALFVGIAVGVLAGMIPLPIPGVPLPVRLGFAGGPLLAAILFSLVGSVGRFVWYMPDAANLALRQLGIILFLAAAGLTAGRGFLASAMSVEGLKWMAAGIVVTMLPLIATAIVARMRFRQNYLTICGVIAGGMTDPPALAFANSFADSPAASTAYAAVYPLAMILRIVVAQTLVLLLV